MKEILLSAGIVLLLSACGNGETESQTEEQSEESGGEEVVNMMGGDVPGLEDYDEYFGFDMSNATEDLMEFAQNPNVDVYFNEEFFTAYQKLGTFTTDSADENGTLRSERGGFKSEVNVLLIEDDLGDRHIAVVGEQINQTDDVLYASSQHDMTTDSMEQLRASSGLSNLGGMYEPNTRHQGMSLATLQFPKDLPTGVNMRFDGIYNTHESEYGDDPAYYGDDYFIEYNEMQFTLME